jgi:carboxyl-terminal processing protease
MRLTTARYYTPSGRSIQAKGIDPDIVVEAAKIEKTPDKAEPKVATASDLKRDDSGDGAEQSSIDPSIMGTPADYQLTRAVDMLRGIGLFNGRVVN